MHQCRVPPSLVPVASFVVLFMLCTLLVLFPRHSQTTVERVTTSSEACYSEYPLHYDMLSMKHLNRRESVIYFLRGLRLCWPIQSPNPFYKRI